MKKYSRKKLVEHFLDNGEDDFAASLLFVGFSKKSINVIRKKMLKSREIQDLIAAEKARRAAEHDYTAEKARGLLEKVMEESKTAGDRTNRIAAIKELNLMEHIYDERPPTNTNLIFVIGKGFQPQDVVEGEVVQSQDVGSKGE